MFLATPGLELKGGSKVVAGCSASAALGRQRSDWERKEGEVNPACRKTASSLRVQVLTYPLQLRVNPPHPQGLIAGPRNQLVVFRT